MKKRTKTLILISMLLVIFIALLLFIIYTAGQYDKYSVKITNISNNCITVSQTIKRSYTYTKEDEVFFDNNGETLDSSEINVGDKLYVIGKISQEKEKATVVKIIDERIVVEAESGDTIHQISIDTAKKAIIKDSDNKKIDVSDLKVGDNLYIIDDNGKIENQMYLENLKLIKVLNQENT